MEVIYQFMEKVLPFSWVQYDFMKNALLAILIITPLFALLGTMIVERHMAFFSDALGHSALTGIAVGVLLGVTNTNVSMIIFGILFAILLNKLNSKRLIGTDTLISVFSSLSIAIGLVVLSQGGNFGKYSSLLVGDILSITPREILYLLLVFVFVLGLWGFCYNQLQSISLNVSLARSRRMPVKFLQYLFDITLAIIVMLSIKWVGILIINALLILPAAAARNISENAREYLGFSLLFSILSGICGLLISYFVNTASGPTIVMIASLIFFATYIYGYDKQK